MLRWTCRRYAWLAEQITVDNKVIFNSDGGGGGGSRTDQPAPTCHTHRRTKRLLKSNTNCPKKHYHPRANIITKYFPISETQQIMLCVLKMLGWLLFFLATFLKRENVTIKSRKYFWGGGGVYIYIYFLNIVV